jgi:hypothetical protein
MKGLKIPFGVGSNGGLATVEKEENNSQIISLFLGEGDNENAFMQDITLGIDMIFDLADAKVRTRIINRVKNLFEKLKIQKRFDLLQDTIFWNESNIENGELILSARYIDLESDDEKTFEQKFNSTMGV